MACAVLSNRTRAVRATGRMRAAASRLQAGECCQVSGSSPTRRRWPQPLHAVSLTYSDLRRVGGADSALLGPKSEGELPPQGPAPLSRAVPVAPFPPLTRLAHVGSVSTIAPLIVALHLLTSATSPIAATGDFSPRILLPVAYELLAPLHAAWQPSRRTRG